MLNEDLTPLEIPITQNEETKNTDDSSESNVTETYWRSEYHNCHAYKLEHNICCVLYASVVPLTTMR